MIVSVSQVYVIMVRTVSEDVAVGTRKWQPGISAIGWPRWQPRGGDLAPTTSSTLSAAFNIFLHPTHHYMLSLSPLL